MKMIASPTNYLVCAHARSGSSVFCDALAATRLAGKPQEFFLEKRLAHRRATWERPEPFSMLAYVGCIREETRTPNDAFGAKAMFSDLAAALEQLPVDPTRPPAAALEQVLPGVRYVRIRRRDVVRQAVSHLRAMQTDLWSSKHALKNAPAAAPAYDFAALDQLVATIGYFDDQWDQFLAGAPQTPIEVYYEDFVADQTAAVRRVLGALGIDAPSQPLTRPVHYEVQGDALNEDWARRYVDQKDRALN